MNEHNLSFWEVRPPAPKVIQTAEDEETAFWAMRSNRKPVIILSDFDNTLCDTSTFDPESNDHIPQLDLELLEHASRLPLIVATGRRANHPWIPTMWESGLVQPGVPVITENGGVLNVRHEGGAVERVVLAPIDQINDLKDWATDAATQHQTEVGKRVIVKQGLSALVMRVQNEVGKSERKDQVELLEFLGSLGLPETFTAVHSGNSLTLQTKNIDKAQAFHEVLDWLQIRRSDIQVIGVGDSINDEAIFREADVSVGVHRDVAHLVDIAGLRGVETTKLLLSLPFRTSTVNFIGRSLLPAEVSFFDDRLQQERKLVDISDMLEMQARAIRFEVTRRIGKLKVLAGSTPVDKQREAEQFARIKQQAEQNGLPPALEQAILRLKIDAVVAEHEEIMRSFKTASRGTKHE